jgi:hypothetical protein
LVRLSLIFVQRGEFTGVGQNDDINVDWIVVEPPCQFYALLIRQFQWEASEICSATSLDIIVVTSTGAVDTTISGLIVVLQTIGT